jgi:outer membrane protein assembly factor BamB
MRRLISTGLVLSLAVAAIGAPKFGSAQSATGWSTFHGNAARDGLSANKGPTLSTASGIWQLPKAVNSSPVVDANGTAYVGDDDGRVYALDPAYARTAGHLGAPKWSFATKDVVVDAPTLSPDGQTLYVGSNDGFVYALKTSDGSKIWATDFGGPVNGSPVLSSDGTTVYDASINGTVKALKASDGTITLSRNLNGGIRGNMALSPDGSTLYAALTTSQLDGIPVGGSGGNAGITGFYLDGPPIGSPAVDPQGNVYITTGAGTLMSFAASNTTPRAGYPFVIPNRVPALTTPAIANGLVMFGAGNGVFYAVNSASAQVQWQFQTRAPIESSAAVGTGSPSVYFGSDDASIHALDASGSEKWSRPVGTSVTSSPAIAADGSLWVGSQSGAVYRIQDLAPPPPISTPSPGPSPTPASTNTPGPTSTPGPTATSTAPTTAPLTITAKASVAAGKTQVVNFVTTAGVQISVRVNYPNGDHQSKKVKANARGHATYSYTQGASKIKHKSSIATIIATVGTGATLTTKQVTYTIGFGKLDISVDPRTVAAKKVVNIYIHSKVGKRVAAYLLFPSGRFVTLPGTAGSKGWAHIKYTVPTKATKGSKHKVTVQARPFNNPKISTKTTFTIK